MRIKNEKSAKEKIEESYIELLEKNDIDKLTVTKIVKIAKINRSTFYDNYNSIDELERTIIDKLSVDLLNKSVEGLSLNDTIVSASTIIKRILITIKENKKLFMKINSKRSPLTVFDKYLNSKYFKKEDDLFKAYFFRSGMDAIINKWLNGDISDDIDTISNKTTDLIHRIFDN